VVEETGFVVVVEPAVVVEALVVVVEAGVVVVLHRAEHYIVCSIK